MLCFDVFCLSIAHFYRFLFLAEMVAKKFGVTRDEMDDFAYASHKKAHDATVSGRFQRELVPVKGKKYLFFPFLSFYLSSLNLTFSSARKGRRLYWRRMRASGGPPTERSLESLSCWVREDASPLLPLPKSVTEVRDFFFSLSLILYFFVFLFFYFF